MKNINWSKQHCGVIHSSYGEMIELMPDLEELIDTFPRDPTFYLWDVKVHMLMPGQYPCIPNWHRDMVPRVNGKEDDSLIDTTKDMYLWLSGGPLTEFRDGVDTYLIEPEKWHRFTQDDWHRGHPSKNFTWRGLIRATHIDLQINSENVNNPFKNKNPLRRHSQVYVDANNFNW